MTACAAYAAVACAGCAALGVYVSPRGPSRVDASARALRGRALPVAAFFTNLGYWPALTVLGAATIASSLGRVRPLWLPTALVASHAIAQIAVIVLKPMFHRERPAGQLVNREVDASYPSGHSSSSITFYLALVVLVPHVRAPQPVLAALGVSLGICAIGIPWSRIALGAHYFTDVVGGLLFGSGWLAASIALYLGLSA